MATSGRPARTSRWVARLFVVLYWRIFFIVFILTKVNPSISWCKITTGDPGGAEEDRGRLQQRGHPRPERAHCGWHTVGGGDGDEDHLRTKWMRAAAFWELLCKNCNIQSVIILLAYKVQGRFCATCKGRNVNNQKLQTKCACSTFPVMNGTYLMRSHNHNQEFAQEFAFSSKNSKSHV